MVTGRPDERVICRITMTARHAPTGNTRHLDGVTGEEFPPPIELRIVQYAGDPGFYLFYCDETGAEFTDTYHDTLEGAKAQAAFEFNVQPNEWTAAV